jgi:aspartate/methionine/tyrosine aminotransferase|tara:strand:- start:169 stop:1329 length:1161 start_codon:yes stop_codon:yes gene_type:complete
MNYKEPWSKKHKRVTGGLPYNLSNSFSEPLSTEELINYSLARGDSELVDDYYKHTLSYTPNGGSLDLRVEVAKFYGPQIGADNILIFAGGQVALQTAACAILDSDSHSIVFTPGYQSVQQAPENALSKITKIKLHANNQWQIDPVEVEAAIESNTQYIVFNEPYNPAGTLMKADIQQKLVAIARKYNITILCDEAYRLLEHDEKDRLPAMADLYENGISACTISKPWGGCGITIGWLALQDLKLKQKLVDVQYFGTACASRASEIQAIMTLRASDIILKKNLQIIQKNLQLLDQFMLQYGDVFEWVRPTASAVGFIRFKGPLSSDELGELLARDGISVKPTYAFTDETTEYKDYFRIGFGEKVMPTSLQALACFVEKHKDAWRLND